MINFFTDILVFLRKRRWDKTWGKLDWKKTPDDKLEKQINSLLQNHSDINAKDEGGKTPLMYAVFHGRTQIIEKLIDAGANINEKNEANWPILTQAVICGQIDVIQKLIDAGIKLNVQNNLGKTALMYAAQDGNLAIVKKLIEAGENINIQDKNGNTPLMYAAQEGHKAIIKCLIESGADSNVKNLYGNTASKIIENSEKLLVNINSIYRDGINSQNELFIRWKDCTSLQIVVKQPTINQQLRIAEKQKE